MLPVDLDHFWKDDALAHEDNCFSPNAPQVALGIAMSEECVYAELDEPGEPWLEAPRARRLELNRRYNDKAEQIVGRRLLPEQLPEEDAIHPPFRGVHELFGGKYVVQGGSNWLQPSCGTPQELEAVLDRADAYLQDIRGFALPPEWESEKKRIFEQYGVLPRQYRGIRGPVTLAMSLYGTENLIFLMMDEPELAQRFSQTILRAILAMTELMDDEAGYTEGNRPGGFEFFDDDCCLLSPEMYESFGFPILKAVFDRRCPNLGDVRYQHSDSPMGHLLPILAQLNFTSCNFGPTLTVSEIRRHMPRTRIDGQLAPFTFMRNNEEEIVAEVRRDCEMARPERGLCLSTAGSINNGSSLASMRAVMHAIQQYGRY